MSQTYTNLISKLKAKLEALKDGNDVAIFKNVFDYAEGDFSGYPSATIVEKGGAGQTIDTHRTERAFTFEITLYQEQSQAGKTKSEAATIMRSIVDQVIQSFDEDPQLGGEVMRVVVVDVVLDFAVKQGTFNFARFTVQCNDLVNTHT
jgi:hypothetical protein